MRLPSLALLFLVLGCQESTSDQHNIPVEASASNSVWSIDLIRTLPGQQAEYLRNIEANWANARRIARERQAVLSYQAFAAAPDSLRAWDVMLMTEYTDSLIYAEREAIFEKIFESPEYVRVPMAKPSSELREFATVDVVMQALVSEPSR